MKDQIESMELYTCPNCGGGWLEHQLGDSKICWNCERRCEHAGKIEVATNVIEESPPFGEWQPIGTAPQTGQTILLGYFNELGKWRTMRGQWMSREFIDDCCEEPETAEPGWYETAVEPDEPPNCWAVAPTHWMPLPEPPSRKEVL